MRDLMDSAKDAWWLTLIVPIKLLWRSIWRMMIFAVGPDVYEEAKTDYDREHRMRMDAEAELTIERAENDRLRHLLAASNASHSNRPDSSSS